MHREVDLLLRRQVIPGHRRDVHLVRMVGAILDLVSVAVSVVPVIIPSRVVVQRRLATSHDDLFVVVMRKVEFFVRAAVQIRLIAVRLLISDIIQVCVAQAVIGADDVILWHWRAVVVGAVAGAAIAVVSTLAVLEILLRWRVVGRRGVNPVLDGRGTVQVWMGGRRRIQMV